MMNEFEIKDNGKISFSEVYVPTGWTKTKQETPQNLLRSAWPQVEGIEKNIFDLTILVNNKIDDDPINNKKQLILNYIYENNEISLVQEAGAIKQKSILDDELSTGGREFAYLLKVIDHDTNTTMYYKCDLERVEAPNQKEIVVDDNPLSEHLEVIAKLDDEDDNPFDTEFDIPEDYKKKEE